MSVGLIARKAGMTQIFAEDGSAVPVTVLDVEPCTIVARRTGDRDGYDAVQVGYGVAARRTTRPVQGHFARQGQEVTRGLKEFRVAAGDSYELGQELNAGLFTVGQKLDASGTSKGRGFAGVMKRYDFGGGRASHGAEKVHRQMGSTGQCQWPGRVFPERRCRDITAMYARPCRIWKWSVSMRNRTVSWSRVPFRVRVAVCWNCVRP